MALWPILKTNFLKAPNLSKIGGLKKIKGKKSKVNKL